MDWKLQRELSEEAGTNEDTGETWADMYDYHLGTVKKPLPFGQFRMKVNTLNKILSLDPEGKQMNLDEPINTLCRELGY